MGTEILRPQDYFTERLIFVPPSFSVSPRRKPTSGNYSNPNPNPNPKSCRKQALRPAQSRKRSPPPQAHEPLISKQGKDFTLGQVTILKRGEPLNSKSKSENLKKTFSVDLVALKEKKENLKKTFSGDLKSLEKKNESLKKTFSGDLLLTGNERLGPEPNKLPVQLNDLKPMNRGSTVYAGSAFDVSPSPRALPLPKFSMKKEAVAVDDFATKDLRRLLRIN